MGLTPEVTSRGQPRSAGPSSPPGRGCFSAGRSACGRGGIPHGVIETPPPMTLVVHPHFHRRRTGVTAHTELIVPELGRLMETRALGGHLASNVPRIPWGELGRRIREEPVVWHAHRNNELLFGFLLRLLGRRVPPGYTRPGPHHTSGFTPPPGRPPARA